MKLSFKRNKEKDMETNDFSAFFLHASAGEKKKLFKRVVRKANQDQRDLVKRYEKLENQR